MKKLFAALLCLSGGLSLHGQARPTASRAGDLQIGGSYTTANSDYVPNRIRGFGFYADFDLREHIGIEAEFHQINDPNTIIYERTYEVGARYVYRPRRFDRASLFAKGMYGRGVFNFPPPFPPPYPQNQPAANLAYNLAALGAGVDIAVHPRVNVRIEYEYQKWFGFPPDGLTPQLITFGAAYHFPAGRAH